MALLGKEILKNASKYGISNLSDFQTQSITKILSNKNTVLISEPGSGKTISYILSVSSLTSLTPCLNPEQYTVSSLFKSPNKLSVNIRPHGSLIIAPTHERSLKIYKYFRQLAPWLKVKRTSATMTSFLGTFGLNANNVNDSEELDKEAIRNIARSVEWNSTDVLISTPAMLNEFMDFRQQLDLNPISPAYIVIDEIDWVLEASDVCKNLKKSFDYIEDCSEKQFILSGSILPFSEVSPNPLAILQKDFKHLECVMGNRDHIPEDLGVSFVAESEGKTKMEALEEILKNSKHERIAVFSNFISRCSDIEELCKTKGIKSVLIVPNIDAEKRISDFLESYNEKVVIIGNELASRGFDLNVDQVILYNLPVSINSLINRVGKVLRQGKAGSLTVMLDKEEEKFTQYFQPGGKWSSLLSFYSTRKQKKIHSLFSKY